jgi:hypothetical protein
VDADTATDIGRWRREQDREREAAAGAWEESGFEFTDEHGRPLNPAHVTGMFHMIRTSPGCPRSGCTTCGTAPRPLLLAAGHDMKVVQETLGLSSITIAADTYTSVLPQLARKSAEDVAALVRPAPPKRVARWARSRENGPGVAARAEAGTRSGVSRPRPSLNT